MERMRSCFREKKKSRNLVKNSARSQPLPFNFIFLYLFQESGWHIGCGEMSRCCYFQGSCAWKAAIKPTFSTVNILRELKEDFLPHPNCQRCGDSCKLQLSSTTMPVESVGKNIQRKFSTAPDLHPSFSVSS